MAKDLGDKLEAPSGFDGPGNDKKFTDIVMALAFLAMVAAMTAIGVYAINEGDYRLILYPMDYDGNVCGTNYGRIDMSDYPSLYILNFVGSGVCVKECPSISEELGYGDVYTLVTYGNVYQVEGQFNQAIVDALGNPPIEMADYSSSPEVRTCTEDNKNDCYPNDNPAAAVIASAINSGYGYAFFLGDTTNYLHRCIMSSGATDYLVNEAGLESLTDIVPSDDATDFISSAYSDLYVAQAWLFYGILFAIVISLGYAYILRIPGMLFTVVWGSLIGTIAVIAYFGYTSTSFADDFEDDDPQVYSDDQITGMRYFGYAMYVVAGLIALVVICLRKSIMLSIGIVKESARCVHAMPTILMFPVVQSVALIVFLVVWLIYAVYLASLGDIMVKTVDDSGVEGVDVQYRTFEYDEATQQYAWFLLFCLYWTFYFIEAVGSMVVARAVASWYFVRDKSTIGTTTVLHSMRQVITYHLGTCAFGSLIIAIVSLIRAILAYIQKQVEEKSDDNKFVKAVGCMLQCCFWCLEQCIRFINKHAYIQTAIFSTSFCVSARNGFFLVARNAGRIGAVSAVSEVVIIFGKIFITATTGLISYYLIEANLGDDLDSVLVPVVFIMIMAYFVASLFFSIFSMAVDTILECFVADEEMFDGDDCYAENDLKEWIDNNG